MQAATYLLISVTNVVVLNYLCLADPVFICFYQSSARLRTNAAKFEIKDINFTLCTHYIYHSAQIIGRTNTLASWNSTLEEGPTGLYRQFTNAKRNFTSIKTLLSVGSDDSQCFRLFKSIGENDTNLRNFTTSAVELLRRHGFDGLAINLRYMGNDTKIAHDNILKALRAKFDEDTTNRLMLTASAPAIERYIDGAYDVASMAKSVDYVIIATDDLFTGTVDMAQFHSPLYSSRNETYLRTLSMNYSVHAWKSRGMPFNKIIVGFTGRGRFQDLVNRSEYGPWAPVRRYSKYGPIFSIRNMMTYIEICSIANQSQKYYAEIQKSPYLVSNYSWVGYDDADSLDLKIKWVKHHAVAGYMFFSLDDDDFTGTWCGKGKYPLVSAMKHTIDTYVPETTTVFTESNTTMSPTSGNGTDTDEKAKNGTDKDGADNAEKDKVVKDSTGKDSTGKDSSIKTKVDSSIVSNLMYGFMIVLIPVVCLAMAFLCGRRQRHQEE